MNWPNVRFGLAAVLFASWIVFLSYLALTTSRPIVLSRAQLLVSSVDVIAHLDKLDGEPLAVTVQEVIWPPNDPEKLTGKTISVRNLSESGDDWRGPGSYILPLLPQGRDAYRIAPVPRSPGFAGPSSKAGRPRIYPLTADTRRQLATIRKPEVPIDPGLRGP